jgi:hypothetical protein
MAKTVNGTGENPMRAAVSTLGSLVRAYSIPPEMAVIKAMGTTAILPVSNIFCQASFGFWETAMTGTPETETPKAKPAYNPVEATKIFSAFILSVWYVKENRMQKDDCKNAQPFLTWEVRLGLASERLISPTGKLG